jgi:hypothetical protein
VFPLATGATENGKGVPTGRITFTFGAFAGSSFTVWATIGAQKKAINAAAVRTWGTLRCSILPIDYHHVRLAFGRQPRASYGIMSKKLNDLRSSGNRQLNLSF